MYSFRDFRNNLFQNSMERAAFQMFKMCQNVRANWDFEEQTGVYYYDVDVVPFYIQNTIRVPFEYDHTAFRRLIS